MKITLSVATAIFLIATPAMAKDGQRAAPTAKAAAQKHATATPRHDHKKHPNWRRINHQLNKRAKNAVKNGARPKVIRQKLKAHKRKLRQRWKAAHK